MWVSLLLNFSLCLFRFLPLFSSLALLRMMMNDSNQTEEYSEASGSQNPNLSRNTTTTAQEIHNLIQERNRIDQLLQGYATQLGVGRAGQGGGNERSGISLEQEVIQEEDVN